MKTKNMMKTERIKTNNKKERQEKREKRKKEENIIINKIKFICLKKNENTEMK